MRHTPATSRVAAEADQHRPIVRQMADVIRERTSASGSCTEDDLRTAGFTAAEIAAHADDARAFLRALMAH